jgi:hypothetical protein
MSKSTAWQTVKTVGYTGAYDYGPNYDRRACGGVVHIQERTVNGRVERRAVTANGRYSFVTTLESQA